MVRAIVRRVVTPHAASLPACRAVVTGRVGLEIGGPSPIFAQGGLLPLYSSAARIDNVNFAQRTIWEGEIVAGDSFKFHPRKPPGTQYIGEGADLSAVPSDKYDFVLSSHMLEHTANPLRALTEWARVLNDAGSLVLVVPHRDGTFDHRRPVTTLAHLIEDFERGMGEDDLTHVPEVLALHDGTRDVDAHDMGFDERCARNAELRSVHHHVFDTRLAMAAVEQVGLVVSGVEPLKPYHAIVLASKPTVGRAAGLSHAARRAALQRSPFATDRAGT